MKKALLYVFNILSISGIAQIAPSKADTINSKTITSVTVTYSKPVIQTLVDKTVFNVSAMSNVAGLNALELLKTAPGVVVDPNENIQMGGKNGVTVMIDNRNTQLSAQDLAQFLKSIDADNIKEIEIISNPSANYDAAGNAGIINIKLKKSLTNGFNGSVSASYIQSTHARGSTTANLNYRKNKWNLFANGGFNDGFQITIANNDRINGDTKYVQRGIEEEGFHGGNWRTGIDYSINKKSTIGILWMHNNRYTRMDNTNNTIVQQIGLPDTNVYNRSIAPNTNDRDNYNMNYKYAIDNKSELNIDADYTSFKSTLDNTIATELFNQSNAKFDSKAIQNNASVAIQIKSIKVDFIQYFNDKTSFEAGAKSVYTNANNQINVYQLRTAGWIADSSKTNLFQYTEAIQAGYINFKTKFNKLSLQFGLRGEYSNIKGASIDLAKNQLLKPDTSYFNLFPTLFVQYKLSDKNQFGFSASRRIDRPNYQDQNPFIYVLDAFNSEQGNPFLIPQYTNSASISYTYNNATTLKMQYAHTTGYIESITYQTGKGTVQTPQNVGTRTMFNFELSSSVTIKKWWDLYFNAEPFFQQYQTNLNGYGTSEKINQESWGFNGYMSNTIDLSKGWKGSISSWFNFQNQTTIYQSKPLSSFSVGISKKLFKEKASIKFNVNDVFNTQRWEQTAITSSLNMLTYRKWESRNITISFSYRFGNNKIKSARDRGTGAENEIGRIK